MHKTLFSQIEQRVMLGADALLLEIVTEDATLSDTNRIPCKWFLQWAQKEPGQWWYTYWIGGCLIGYMFKEVADFNTLHIFVTTYEEAFDRMWADYIDMIEDDLIRRGVWC